jgi:hypothetical protein
VAVEQMAPNTGVTLATYRRLERGQNRAPNLRYLANCALVLRVELDDLIEDEWREWWVFDVVDAAGRPMTPSWLRRPRSGAKLGYGSDADADFACTLRWRVREPLPADRVVAVVVDDDAAHHPRPRILAVFGGGAPR